MICQWCGKEFPEEEAVLLNQDNTTAMIFCSEECADAWQDNEEGE